MTVKATVSNQRTSQRLRWGKALFVGLLVLGLPGTAWGDDDGDMDQHIDPGQQVADEVKILPAGHIDIGPRFVDDVWKLMIHDDAAKADANAASFWRYPEQTVLQVTDTAIRQVPDNPDYDFLGSPPGTDVWVIPQTQNLEVVWVGWNTQDPEVMERISRGVTLTLTGITGPGDLVVYLQSGDFGAPEVLWDTKTPPASLWIDVNSHTHANWVFSEPGIYLAQFEITADLIDGSTVIDTQELRFAVGNATNTDEALAATWNEPLPENTPGPGNESSESPGGKAPGETEVPAKTDPAKDPFVLGLIIAIILVAAGLIIGFGVMIVRDRRAKKIAQATHSESNDALVSEAEGADVPEVRADAGLTDAGLTDAAAETPAEETLSGDQDDQGEEV